MDSLTEAFVGVDPAGLHRPARRCGEGPAGCPGAGGARLSSRQYLRRYFGERRPGAPALSAHLPGHGHSHFPHPVSGRSERGGLRAQAEAAVAEATRRAYLRPNAVDSLTGRNSGNNLGIGFPVFHFEEGGPDDPLEVALLLKGGGSENVSIQYSLPYEPLKAGRDLEGVRRVVLDAVHRAQGEGCAPGILGVCIGGDRGTGYMYAKMQLLRPLDDTNPVPELAALEERLLRECNELGVGPMGFGGKTTVLGVKIGAAHRLPASFFVTVAYMCWACRRARMTVRNGEVLYT